MNFLVIESSLVPPGRFVRDRIATRSMIGKVLTRLRGNPLFAEPGQIQRLEMCEDCRVRDLFDAERAQAEETTETEAS